MITKARRARFDFDYYRDMKYRRPGRPRLRGITLVILLGLVWVNAVVWTRTLSLLFGGE